MATIASIDTAVRANTQHFERGMSRARNSLKGFSKDMGFAVKLAKGGGIFIGATFLAHQISSFAKHIDDLNTSFRAGKIDASELTLEVGKAIPLLGRWVSLVDDIEQGFGSSRKQANALVSILEERLNILKKQKELERSFAVENFNLDSTSQIERERLAIQQEFQKRQREILAEKFSYDKKFALITQAEIIAQKKMQKADEALERRKEQRRRDAAAQGFTFNFLTDSISFVEQQAQRAKDIQEEIAKQAELGIQKSVEAQEMANERMARDFVAKRIKANSVETPLFAETATFGSRAAFEARQRLIRGDTKEDPSVTAKKILDEAKKQNQNLEKVIEALREQFPEANL